jgi:preprotein translocase subunit SecG
MQTVLIVIHIMVVLALIATVLLQRSEGGALGIGGGGGFMTGRGQANVLTRATAVLAALFFATSLGLTLLANASRPGKSIFETAVPASAPSTPAKPGTLLQQLKKQQQDLQQHPQPPAPPAQPEPPRSQ